MRHKIAENIWKSMCTFLAESKPPTNSIWCLHDETFSTKDFSPDCHLCYRTDCQRLNRRCRSVTGFTLYKDINQTVETQKGQLNGREALQLEAPQSRVRPHVRAVVTVISKGSCDSWSGPVARVGRMGETEAEGSTDGVETETIELINTRSEHDLSVWPLCWTLVKKTRGDDDSTELIFPGESGRWWLYA